MNFSSTKTCTVLALISFISISTCAWRVSGANPSYSFSVETSDEYQTITVSFTGYDMGYAEIYLEGSLVKNATSGEHYAETIHQASSGDFEIILLVYHPNGTLYESKEFYAHLGEAPFIPQAQIPDIWVIFVLIILITFGATVGIMAGSPLKRARGQRASYTKK